MNANMMIAYMICDCTDLTDDKTLNGKPMQTLEVAQNSLCLWNSHWMERC